MEVSGGVCFVYKRQTYTLSLFTTDATKSTNPIELQVAPGRNFRVGLKVTW